jgi:cytochrome c-type biogenesis protein CcmH
MRPIVRTFGLLVMLSLTNSVAAVAVEPGERLSDPVLEARARALSSELRCLVCQNQSIDDSSAPLARDLRVIVRERLQTGETDEQVMRFVVDRFGEFVLLRPKFGIHTLALWLAPLLVLTSVCVVWWRRRRDDALLPARADAPLNADEQKRLDEILKQRV